MEYWQPLCSGNIKYCISTFGRVWSSRVGVMKFSATPTGYQFFDIRLNSQTLRNYIHRAVAQIFIENPENKSCVNHINGVKSDNRVVNLEWCSHSENNIHSYRVLKNIPVSARQQPVVAFRHGMSIVLEFDGLRDCGRYLGIPHERIKRCALGRTPPINGWQIELI